MSVHRGEGVHPLGRQSPGTPRPPGTQLPPRQTPPQVATAADGTHPTGMHSY